MNYVKALSTAFPEFGDDVRRLRQSGEEPPQFRSFFDQFAKQMGIDSSKAEDWYNVDMSKLQTEKVIKPSLNMVFN